MEAAVASTSLASKHSTIMEEMSRVHDLLCQLRAIVLPSAPVGRPCELARDLFKGIFGSVDIVLSNLQSFPQLQEADPDEVCEHSKRRKVESWTVTTTVPHNDGHQWRKYGQKPINSSKFPRSYYKCAYHRDQGCSSTKTVQQRHGNHNPPKYQVTYNMHHTCKPAVPRSRSDKDSPSKKTASSENELVEPQTDNSPAASAAAEVHGQGDNSPAGSAAAEVHGQSDHHSPAGSAVLTELDLDDLPSIEAVTNIPKMKDVNHVMPNIFSPCALDGDFWSNVDEMLGLENGYSFDEFTDL